MAEKEQHKHEHHHHEHHHHEHHHHGDGAVKITHHDGAVVGTLKGVMPIGNYNVAETKLAEQMREAGRRITEVGGIIGHIKFLLSTSGRCSQISVTDVNENIRRFDGNSSQVEGVAIVFALEDDTLVHILEETIGTLFEQSK